MTSHLFFTTLISCFVALALTNGQFHRGFLHTSYLNSAEATCETIARDLETLLASDAQVGNYNFDYQELERVRTHNHDRDYPNRLKTMCQPKAGQLPADYKVANEFLFRALRNTLRGWKHLVTPNFPQNEANAEHRVSDDATRIYQGVNSNRGCVAVARVINANSHKEEVLIGLKSISQQEAEQTLATLGNSLSWDASAQVRYLTARDPKDSRHCEGYVIEEIEGGRYRDAVMGANKIALGTSHDPCIKCHAGYRSNRQRGDHIYDYVYRTPVYQSVTVWSSPKVNEQGRMELLDTVSPWLGLCHNELARICANQMRALLDYTEKLGDGTLNKGN